MSALKLGNPQLLLTLELQQENEAAKALGQLRVNISWPAQWIPASLHPPWGAILLCSVPGLAVLQQGFSKSPWDERSRVVAQVSSCPKKTLKIPRVPRLVALLEKTHRLGGEVGVPRGSYLGLHWPKGSASSTNFYYPWNKLPHPEYKNKAGKLLKMRNEI